MAFGKFYQRFCQSYLIDWLQLPKTFYQFFGTAKQAKFHGVYARRNREFLRRPLKTDGDGAELMSGGSSFYSLAPQTGDFSFDMLKTPANNPVIH